MTLSENLRSSPNVVSRYLPMIISYLPLVDLLTWHFHVTISVALNFGKQNVYFPILWGCELPSLGFPHIFCCFFLFQLWCQLNYHNRWTASAVQYNSEVLKLCLSATGVHTSLYYWRVMTIFFLCVLQGLKKIDSMLHSCLILLFLYLRVPFGLPYVAWGVIQSHFSIRLMGHIDLGDQSCKCVPSLQ